MLMYLLALATIVFAIFGCIIVWAPPRDANVSEVTTLHILEDVHRTQLPQLMEKEEAEDKLWQKQDKIQRSQKNKGSLRINAKSIEEASGMVGNKWITEYSLEDMKRENGSPAPQQTDILRSTVPHVPSFTVGRPDESTRMTSDSCLEGIVSSLVFTTRSRCEDVAGMEKDLSKSVLSLETLQTLAREKTAVPIAKRDPHEIHDITMEEPKIGTELTNRAKGDKGEAEVYREDETREERGKAMEKTISYAPVMDEDAEKIKAEKVLLNALSENGLRENLRTERIMSMEESLNNGKREESIRTSLLEPEQ